MLSFPADKVTTETYNFVSVIVNVAPVGAAIAGVLGIVPCAKTATCVIISVKTQFLDQVKVKGTSQLINGVSNVLQKLRRCFNGTANSTPLVSLTGVFPVMLLLYSNDGKFVIESAL